MTTLDEWGLAAPQPPVQYAFAQDGGSITAQPAPAGSQLIVTLTGDITTANESHVGGVSSEGPSCFSASGDTCPNGSIITLILDGTPGTATVTWPNNSFPGDLSTATFTINIPGETGCPPGTVQSTTAFGGPACVPLVPGGGGAKATGPVPPTTTPSSTGTIIGVIAAAAVIGGAVYFFTR